MDLLVMSMVACPTCGLHFFALREFVCEEWDHTFDNRNCNHKTTNWQPLSAPLWVCSVEGWSSQMSRNWISVNPGMSCLIWQDCAFIENIHWCRNVVLYVVYARTAPCSEKIICIDNNIDCNPKLGLTRESANIHQTRLTTSLVPVGI